MTDVPHSLRRTSELENEPPGETGLMRPERQARLMRVVENRSRRAAEHLTHQHGGSTSTTPRSTAVRHITDSGREDYLHSGYGESSSPDNNESSSSNTGGDAAARRRREEAD